MQQNDSPATSATMSASKPRHTTQAASQSLLQHPKAQSAMRLLLSLPQNCQYNSTMKMPEKAHNYFGRWTQNSPGTNV